MALEWLSKRDDIRTCERRPRLTLTGGSKVREMQHLAIRQGFCSVEAAACAHGHRSPRNNPPRRYPASESDACATATTATATATAPDPDLQHAGLGLHLSLDVSIDLGEGLPNADMGSLDDVVEAPHPSLTRWLRAARCALRVPLTTYTGPCSAFRYPSTTLPA